MQEIITQDDLKTPHGHKLATMRSMLQKAIRRGKIEDAAYAAHEMYYWYTEYTWKTLLIVSAEDCYGVITQEILALYQTAKMLREKDKKHDFYEIFVSKAIVILCNAKHNRDADLVACNLFNDNLDSKINIKDWDDKPKMEEIPEYVFDCHTKEGRMAGKKKEDFFKKEDAELAYRQPSLFDFI